MALVTLANSTAKPKRFFSYRIPRHKIKVSLSRCFSDAKAPLEVSASGHAAEQATGTIAENFDEAYRDPGLDWSRVPPNPPRSAGILLVVTSPDGKVRLAR
ncbi:hypothetical protein LOZ53_006343 [Ophidiomyces ophidiicola]|uniref:Uncharacterized protein n=1 Tax=Ophidiomyces ophidiicola TaxID=1387563 RepID=A0ACB8UT07_9EURO|nr:uncharacterized protein LOZ57_006552 [Ophidiomyces ophidiicola]KAI1908796.1 hypothetical protein LOZ64_005451 [Ophidiomyces ophidiicola]KAI1913276.1 hypothetical protein LOZ61_002810 [Ophidiomyces ophidiicola]KAI1931011.1 hypothetical protein LOZ60_000445 [Ophidiomyces ophidiicola]KAI1934728.1 hypothetical protein LOZ62_006177 [Ophidiomyces ophidiicola]KAI1937772.1 hypothetical protein LOZ57_006552 [Ophidiomyces ophidiicola]